MTQRRRVPEPQPLIDLPAYTIGLGWPDPADRPMGYAPPPPRPVPTGQQDADRFGYGDAPALSGDALTRSLAGHLTRNPRPVPREFEPPEPRIEQSEMMGRSVPGLLSLVPGLAKGAVDNARANNARIRTGADAMSKKLRGETLTPEQQRAIDENPALGFGTADVGAVGHLPTLAGTFAGRFAKTADLGALETARRLAEAGENMETIRLTTGWFQGMDGQWRFEIPDNKLKITKGGFLGATETGFEHPELEAAYPDLKANTPIDRFASGSTLGYTDKDGRIGINAGLGEAEQRNVLGHELMHKVQGIEGFAPGSSPNRGDVLEHAERDVMPWVLDRAREKVAEYDAALAEWQEQGHRGVMWDRDGARSFAKANPKLAAEAKEARRQIEWAADPMTRQLLAEDIAEALYWHAPGEIEPRAVQDRLDFTPEQRRAIGPYETQRDKPSGLYHGDMPLPPWPWRPDAPVMVKPPEPVPALPAGLLGDVKRNLRSR